MNMAQNEHASLLLVDDDHIFCQVLGSALQKRGFCVSIAHNVEQALPLVAANPPEYAVVDLKMSGASGLTLVQSLHELDSATRIVVLTGYASIATAVKAIKLGADDYLAKPVTASAVVDALLRGESVTTDDLPLAPMSPRRLEWEHIQRILAENDGNISATARTLNMHRRTLQRKLGKRPTRS